ncbi:MAG: SIMPL domain-containing protein, partial [Duodenibacillus sp.]|nr:SIMPL domain-containing protein [Duodenibacillus sp.]
ACAAGVLPAEGALLQISGRASLAVPNDEALLAFYALEDGKTAAEAGAKAARRAAAGLAALKATGVKARLRTAGASTWPVYAQSKDGRRADVRTGWQSRHAVEAVAEGAEDAARLAEAAMPHLAFDGASFRPSRKTAEGAQAELAALAVASVLGQARAAAAALAPGAEITVEAIEFSGAGAARPVMARNMLAAGAAPKAASVAFESGEGRLEVHARAKVRVRERAGAHEKAQP